MKTYTVSFPATIEYIVVAENMKDAVTQASNDYIENATIASISYDEADVEEY